MLRHCYIYIISPFIFHLGFVHPLLGVALHQCPPLPSVCCFPVPGGSLLPCYFVLPSPTWSSFWISSLSLVATLRSVWSNYCPSFLLYVRPISTLFQCVFYNVHVIPIQISQINFLFLFHNHTRYCFLFFLSFFFFFWGGGGEGGESRDCMLTKGQ